MIRSVVTLDNHSILRFYPEASEAILTPLLLQELRRYKFPLLREG